MSLFRKFWLKLTRWEFWPFYIFYIPVIFYYLVLALKSGRFGFLASSNPSMEFGGFTGVSKMKIYELIPARFLPKMKLIKAGDLRNAFVVAQDLSYPLIAKPDMGERGKLVEKIDNQKQLESYVRKCPVDFIIQELITLPLELGIFYIRHPNETKGRITSVAQKQFMSVVGDGNSSVRELLLQNERAKLQLDFEHPRFAKIMSHVPKEAEHITVENIGNHCRGTVFLDRCDVINDDLQNAMDRLSNEIEGFHYGRFDLRCNSLQELKQLQNFKIIELNGAGAEPAHIYQPGFSLIEGYRTVFWHFSQLAKISKANKELGFPQWSFSKSIRKLLEVRRYNQLLKQF